MVTTGILAAWCRKATSGSDKGQVSTGTVGPRWGRRPALPRRALWSYQSPLPASVSPSVKQGEWPRGSQPLGWWQTLAPGLDPASGHRGQKLESVAPTFWVGRSLCLAPRRTLGMDPRGCSSASVTAFQGQESSPPKSSSATYCVTCSHVTAPLWAPAAGRGQHPHPTAAVPRCWCLRWPW